MATSEFSASGLMTYKEANKFLRRVTYKPKAKFRVEFDYNKGATITLYTKRPNTSTKKHKKIDLETRRSIQGGTTYIHATPAQLLTWVRKISKSQEEHERLEWLRLDGRMLHDPHTGKRYRIR